MDLKEETILGDKIHDHWYYISKGRAMRSFIGDIKSPEILDVGAGSGIFSRQLLSHGLCDSAVCLDSNYAEERTESHYGKQIRFVKQVGGNLQKFILMMDVLEHVPDDTDFLKKFGDNLECGGHLFISVPAFNFMWSGHDVFLGHYRRYTINGLENLARKSGLTPIKTRYFFGSLFPVIAANRVIRRIFLEKGKLQPQSDLKLYPDWLNKALTNVHDVERRSVFAFNRFFGLSIFCLCRNDQRPKADPVGR